MLSRTASVPDDDPKACQPAVEANGGGGVGNRSAMRYYDDWDLRPLVARGSDELDGDTDVDLFDS